MLVDPESPATPRGSTGGAPPMSGGAAHAPPLQAAPAAADLPLAVQRSAEPPWSGGGGEMASVSTVVPPLGTEAATGVAQVPDLAAGMVPVPLASFTALLPSVSGLASRPSSPSPAAAHSAAPSALPVHGFRSVQRAAGEREVRAVREAAPAPLIGQGGSRSGAALLQRSLQEPGNAPAPHAETPGPDPSPAAAHADASVSPGSGFHARAAVQRSGLGTTGGAAPHASTGGPTDRGTPRLESTVQRQALPVVTHRGAPAAPALAAGAAAPAGAHDIEAVHQTGGPIAVQRADDATATAAAPAAPAAPAMAGLPQSGQDFEELAGKLYERLRSRLRSELLVDRERAGLLVDL